MHATNVQPSVKILP